jgi:Putative bacterial sensory transduction regulator
MPGSPPEAKAVLEATFRRWLEDPESDVVHVEQVNESGIAPSMQRWAVRMRQTVLDATTVWWEIGQRSLRCEAYVLPAPERDPSEVHRQCLVRNATAWRVHFLVDREGAVVLRGRLPLARVSTEELDLVLGEIYETIEVSFRPLLAAWITGGQRENSP